MSVDVKGICEKCNGNAEYCVTTTRKDIKYHVYACLDETCNHYTYVKLSEESSAIDDE